MVSCFNHLLQLTLSSEQILSQVQGTRKQSISLLAACFLPFKQSPESGDSEQNGYWSYTRPFFPTQNTGKSAWPWYNYYIQYNCTEEAPSK